MSAPLFENEYTQVFALAGEPIVMVVRKQTPVELSDLERAWGAANRALGGVDRRRSCLLVDVSLAVGRNDEEFERAFAPFRRSLCADWLAVALVVSSIPGTLQVQRYAREDDVRVVAYDNRETALAALRRALTSLSTNR